MRKLTFEELQTQKPSIENVLNMQRNPIYLILDNIRSLHNVGAIFRTADSTLVKKIYLCGITAVPPRAEIAKTALGAEEVVPFEYYENSLQAIEALREEGVQIVAVELTEGGKNYWEADLKFPVAFVVGHEVKGVADEVVEACDLAVHLPMMGRASSLNVATCCGIVLYEGLRRLEKI